MSGILLGTKKGHKQKHVVGISLPHWASISGGLYINLLISKPSDLPILIFASVLFGGPTVRSWWQERVWLIALKETSKDGWVPLEADPRRRTWFGVQLRGFQGLGLRV